MKPHTAERFTQPMCPSQPIQIHFSYAPSSRGMSIIRFQSREKRDVVTVRVNKMQSGQFVELSPHRPSLLRLLYPEVEIAAEEGPITTYRDY
jgi:hypothetical protein